MSDRIERMAKEYAEARLAAIAGTRHDVNSEYAEFVRAFRAGAAAGAAGPSEPPREEATT